LLRRRGLPGRLAHSDGESGFETHNYAIAPYDPAYELFEQPGRFTGIEQP
jgi:hypothetical protein